MNLTETTKLCAMVSQLCPGQKFSEYTPDAWQLVMDDVPAADAFAAVRTVYREKGSDAWHGRREIEADDILREVKRVATRRLDAYGPIVPPAALADDPRAEGEWLRDARRRIAQGEDVPPVVHAELKPRDMSVLAGALTGRNLNERPRAHEGVSG